MLFCVTSCHERLWSFSRYKSWLVNAFQWPQLFLVPASLQMRPTWPFLELFAFLCLFRFCAALRAEIEHWLFWILGMVFSLGKQSVIAMFSFALRHHPLLWEVSWALKQFLQSLPIIGLIPISIVTSPQRNLWLWLTSWNLPPHRFLIPGLMFLLIACDGMALISAWDRQGFRSHPIVMPRAIFGKC